MALVDELAGTASWRSLFEVLVGQMAAALESAAASAKELLADCVEPPARGYSLESSAGEVSSEP